MGPVRDPSESDLISLASGTPPRIALESSDLPFREISSSDQLDTDLLNHLSGSSSSANGTLRTRRLKKSVGFSDHGQTVDTQNRPKSHVSDSLTVPASHDIRGDRRSSASFDSIGSQLDGAHLPDLDPEHEEQIRRALADSVTDPVPAKPRPVLKKNSSFVSEASSDGKDDDTPQAVRAREAHERGLRLGHSISATGSRANSPSAGRSRSPRPAHINWQDDDSDTDADDGLHINMNATSRRAAVEATRLVQSHAHNESFYNLPPTPGTRTPQDDYFDDVPRPTTYRAGILGMLLKMYKEDNGSALPSAQVSRASSPVSRRETPDRTPPSTSRPSSPFRTADFRRKLGQLSKWPQAESSRNASTSSLARLVGSTATLSIGASSGPRGMADQVREQLRKHDQQRGRSPARKHKRSRSEQQQYITVHISEQISIQKYLVNMARALMSYGAPTHRLEEYMRMVARVFKIEAQFLYLPGSMIISFDDSFSHTAEVKLVRVAQGVDLGRLMDVYDLYKSVLHDKIGVDEASRRLTSIMAKKPKYPRPFLVLVYGLASASVGPYAFGARFIDLGPCFLLGALLGILQLYVAPISDLYSSVFEVLAAVVTSCLARMIGSISRDGDRLFCFSAMAQSSIALILPGYIVLCAALELQSKNIVAGSVRMVYAIIYSLFLGYGITIGSTIAGLIVGSSITSATTCQGDMPNHLFFIAVPIFTLCLAIINQSKIKQTPLMLVISFTGYIISFFISQAVQGNSQIANSAAAFGIGVMANLSCRTGFEEKCFKLCRDHVKPALQRLWRRREHPFTSGIDPSSIKMEEVEMGGLSSASSVTAVETPSTPDSGLAGDMKRKASRGLAVAAMLPAIFVQVPSGLASGGSLVAGLTSANQIVGNGTNGTTVVVNSTSLASGDGLNDIAFSVGYSVVQVAIGITVGLFLSAIVVYPLAKRRSGLFSL